MTATYLDTSALMRLAAAEGDVTLVEAAMRSGPIASVLVSVELHAAIFRRWRDGLISEAVRQGLERFVAVRVAGALDLLPLDEGVISEARNIVSDHSIRSLDALHVATAALAQRRARRHGIQFRFCTADRRQAEVAGVILGGDHVLFVPPI